MSQQITFDVRLHTSSSNVTHSSHRLAIIRWKDKKDEAGKILPKPPARCISLPKLALEIKPVALAISLQAAFEELQDKLLRSLIEASTVPTFTLTEDQISADAVAAFAASQDGPGKMSGKLLETWFDANLSDNLYVALADKLGLGDQPTEEQTAKVAKATAQFRDFITGLASPRANLAPKIVTELQKAAALAPQNEDDKVLSFINKKLAAFLEPVTATLDFNL